MSTTLASRYSNKLTNLILMAILLATAILALPRGVSAAVPSFDITGVRQDDTITVRTKDFPANVKFTVRMDVAGNQAVDGIVVSELNTGLGGAFEVSFRIPAELRGKQTLSVRFDSAEGYYAFNWFNNKTQGTSPSTNPSSPISIPNTGTSGKPYLDIVGVKKNTTITVEAYNLPANTDFKVRVGPFKTFSTDYVVVKTVNSGATGAIRFNLDLPTVVKDVETVTVRMDGSGRYAYNAFTNADRGTVTPQPTTTPAPVTCSVTSVTPTTSQNKRADFDAVWTVKNTGSVTWDMSSVDYGYLSGTKMYKHNSRYDMTQSVKPGESVKITVDMLAPNQSGLYTTSWALLQSGTNLCTLSLDVRVK
jgi:hypothetical protein